MQTVGSFCPYCDGPMFPKFEFENDLVFMKCDDCGCESPKVWMSSDMLTESVVKKHVNSFLERKIKEREREVEASLNKINGLKKEGEENE